MRVILSKISQEFLLVCLDILIVSLDSKFQISSMYFSIFPKKSDTGLLANSHACFVKLPYISTANISVGRSCFLAKYKPNSSCHGVTL